MTNPLNKAKQAGAVWCVLTLAFVIRALLPVTAAVTTADREVFHSPDTASYTALTCELAETGRFARHGEPEIVRTPGYPLLLLPGIVIGRPELITIALQVILSCLTAYLVYRIALLLFESRRIATVCCLLYAVEPLSVVYTSKLLTETLFTCATALFVLYLAKYLKNGGLRHVVISAAALSASVYVRPISYFLPALVAIGLLLRALRGGPEGRRLLGHACVFFVVSMGAVGLWQVRNAVLAGYGGFSATADINLYFYQGASVLAAERACPYYQVQEEMGYGDENAYLQNHPQQRQWGRAERYRYMRRQGASTLVSHPLTYLNIHLKGMARALFDPGAFAYLKLFKLYPRSGGLLGMAVDRGVVKTAFYLFNHKPLVFWSNVLLGVVLGFYLLLAAVGLFSKAVLKNRAAVMIFLIGVYFLALSGGPQAEGRFRHPVMPMVCVLAGLGLSLVQAWWRRRRSSHGGGKAV